MPGNGSFRGELDARNFSVNGCNQPFAGMQIRSIDHEVCGWQV